MTHEQDPEREAFESWVVLNSKGAPPEEIVRRKPNGRYAHAAIESRWEGWLGHSAYADLKAKGCAAHKQGLA